MDASLHNAAAELLPEIVALRHELHTHPEVRFEERWTSDRIGAFLEGAGIPFKRGYARGTGIVASIEGHPGKTVALRADIDALEIDEQTGLPYSSTIPHRMHACGHDGHTSILCGVAKLLFRERRNLNGAVRLIFQPAEEIAGGGRLMVEEGALDGVDAVFALHGWPGIPLGQVGIKSGAMMASASDFKIVVNGKGCHAADPASGVDPILAGAHITTALHSIVSRELNPWDAGALTVAKFHGGSATNIIPDSVTLEGTFRSLTNEVNDVIRNGIERTATHTARGLRCDAIVEFGKSPYPPLTNDAAMTALVRDAVAAEFGAGAVHDVLAPSMAAEDFAFYLEKVPGTLVWLGLNPDPGRPYAALHNPRFDFNDEALPMAIRYFSAIAFRFLNA